MINNNNNNNWAVLCAWTVFQGTYLPVIGKGKSNIMPGKLVYVIFVVCASSKFINSVCQRICVIEMSRKRPISFIKITQVTVSVNYVIVAL